MKKNISEIPVLRHYDKLLVVFALVVLLVSLAYLIMASMTHEQSVTDYTQAIDNLKPATGRVAPIDMGGYKEAAEQQASPFKMGEIVRTNANFLTPECRKACADTACRRPIPLKAKTCPFCGAEQAGIVAVDPKFSTLKDGIADEYKRKHRIDIRDANAAQQDLDGDGFTLLEEYEADTDPTDPKSHPPYAVKLQLKEFRGKKLPLRFTAVNKMPDGNQLTFNWTDPRNRRTLWIKEGQPIVGDGLKTGFTAGTFTEEWVEKDEGVKKRVDVSTVTVKRDADGKEFKLQINEKEINTDVEAILVFLVDNSELTLLEKQEFKLRDETYRVVSMNERDAAVEVENTTTGNKTSVRKKKET